MQDTPTLAATNALRMELRLEPESEDRVSSQTLERTTLEEDGIEAIVPSATGRTGTPERLCTPANMPVPFVNQFEQRFMREIFGTERKVVSTRRASVSDGAARGNDNGT